MFSISWKNATSSDVSYIDKPTVQTNLEVSISVINNLTFHSDLALE